MTSMTRKMMSGAALVLVMGAGAALPAMAQNGNGDNYDGYCYQKQGDAKTTGTVVGAVAGGVIGSQVSKNERGLGTVAGAVIGGAIGRNIGKDSVKCYNGEYYSYQSSRYDPAPPPDGYQTVYYRSRPDTGTYTTTYYDRDRRSTSMNDSAYNGSPSSQGSYSQTTQTTQTGYYDRNGTYRQSSSSTSYGSRQDGWKDVSGQWHMGRPVAFGWKDDRGRWHEGQLQTYGWQDDHGRWHETSTNYGYNNGSDNRGN